MATSDKSAEVARVSCEVCLKEVPISEARSPRLRTTLCTSADSTVMQSGRSRVASRRSRSKSLARSERLQIAALIATKTKAPRFHAWPCA